MPYIGRELCGKVHFTVEERISMALVPMLLTEMGRQDVTPAVILAIYGYGTFVNWEGLWSWVYVTVPDGEIQFEYKDFEGKWLPVTSRMRDKDNKTIRTWGQDELSKMCPKALTED